MKRFVLFFFILTCCFISSKATIIYWTGAASNNWFNNGNWTGGVKPGINDDVIFDTDATVNMDVFNSMANCNINSLTITNGANVELSYTRTSGGAKNLRLNSISA